MQIYLDNASTTMVCPEAARAALNIMTENYGNPSSTHTMGRNAAKAMEAARWELAAAMGAAPGELYFTSGGTESLNWALRSGALLRQRLGNHIISSAAEHSATLKSLELLERQGFEVTRLSPERDGSISAEAVKNALREDTILVSLMLVNNETGGITDIPAVSKNIKAAGSSALLHTDAVQGFLKLPFTAKSLGADMISFSGHKIHAPKGIGALYVKGGAEGGKGLNLAPLFVGGAQERGKRAGTEALPLIAALGAAVTAGKKAMDEDPHRILRVKQLAAQILAKELPELQILSGEAPHILSISLPGYKSEVLMNYLEGKGFFVSKSSACKKGGRSHVLEAMRLPPPVIDGALRIGFSRYSTPEEAEAFCAALKSASQKLYKSL